MTIEEAVELIRPAVPPARGVWADLGAGSGTFSRALAALAGPGSRVFALDRDPGALRELRRRSGGGPGEGAEIVPVEGDLRRIGEVDALAGVTLDGALLANSLHFVEDAEPVLAALRERVRPGGRVVVVEYEGRRPSRWVPFPVSPERLGSLAAGAGLSPPRRAGALPSAFGGVIYCAWMERPGSPPA